MDCSTPGFSLPHIAQNLSNFMSIESVAPSNHLISLVIGKHKLKPQWIYYYTLIKIKVLKESSEDANKYSHFEKQFGSFLKLYMHFSFKPAIHILSI